MLICARKGCETEFTKKTHNQKYHDDACCKLATNERLMEKYYAKRDQILGKVRICASCNETKLSRYNNTLICSPCELKSETNANNSVMNMILSVSWQV